MNDFFRVDRRELILFVLFAALYTAAVFGWTLFVSDQVIATLPFLASTPLVGWLPEQSISKLVLTVLLFLLSTLYALFVLGAGPHRKHLPQFVGFGLLTFLAWNALNYWVIAGFLNASVLYGVVSVVLLLVWMGGLMRFVSNLHDATAVFLMRLGMGVSLFISIVQIVALLTPEWRSPTQGIPVLYVLTLNAVVGLFFAGVGGNMVWRERREEVLAGGRRKR